MSIFDISTTGLSVVWTDIDPLDQNGRLIAYEIRYTPLRTFGGQISTMSVNATENNMVSLSDLEEFVEYTVSIRGYTREGSGPYSPPLNVTTNQDGKTAFN